MRLGDILAWSAELAGCDTVPADSQVYVEARDDVRRVLFGIDIDLPELLYARDAGYDAVIAHHPAGDRARIDFSRVVRRQVDQMVAEGVPRDTAIAAVDLRIEASERALHIANVNRIVDTARLVGVPFANIHLACDIIGRGEVAARLDERSSASSTVGDSIAWLEEFPEIRDAPARPAAWLGDPETPLGRYTVAMAGGTNGGHPVFREYWRAGVDTIFAMHVGEGDLERLSAEAAPDDNLVVTGHMATDSIGINRVVSALEREGIEVTRTSGVIAGAAGSAMTPSGQDWVR